MFDMLVPEVFATVIFPVVRSIVAVTAPESAIGENAPVVSYRT